LSKAYKLRKQHDQADKLLAELKAKMEAVERHVMRRKQESQDEISE
jgi:hypothetical protein